MASLPITAIVDGFTKGKAALVFFSKTVLAAPISRMSVPCVPWTLTDPVPDQLLKLTAG